MLTFSELRATDHALIVAVTVTRHGDPQGWIEVSDQRQLIQAQNTWQVSSQKPFDIRVCMFGKTHEELQETAMEISQLTIDTWRMQSKHDHLATYQTSDHGVLHTRYLGYNGVWCLSIDQPFWLWHHHCTHQGMLIQPVKPESRQNS